MILSLYSLLYWKKFCCNWYQKPNIDKKWLNHFLSGMFNMSRRCKYLWREKYRNEVKFVVISLTRKWNWFFLTNFFICIYDFFAIFFSIPSCSENVKNNYAQFVYPLEFKHVIIGFVLSDLCYVFIIILGVIAKGDSKIILYCVVFDATTAFGLKNKAATII